MLQWKGEQQEGRVGKPLEPFEVIIKDSEGDPVQLAPVDFVLVQGAGEFSYKDERTDLGGNAIAEFIPSTDGWYRVECFIGEGEDRKMVPFKGNIAPDRRRRTIAPPFTAQETEVTQVTAPPPLPPPVEAAPAQAAAPEVPPQAPMVEPEPPLPPPTIVVLVAPPALAEAIASAQPKPAPAPQARPAAPPKAKPAAAPKAAIAAKPRIAPKVAAPPPQAAPKRRRRAAPPPGSPIGPGLLLAIVLIAGLLAAFTGVLVAQDLSKPRAVVQCAGSAWSVDRDSLVFKQCTSALR